MYKIAILRLLKRITGNSNGTIDTNRAIRKIPDGTIIGVAAMPLVEAIERFMYDFASPVINSFTGGLILEKGEETLTRTLSFNVSAPSGGTIASIIITGSISGASADLKSGTGSQSGTYSVTLAANTNETFTIRVTSNQAKTATSATVFTFKHRLYYGVETDPGSYDEAFIKAMDSNSLDADYSTVFSVNASMGKYIWFAIPKLFAVSPYMDPPYFFLGTAMPGGMQIISSAISYTYGGNTEDYIIYRSAFANLGVTDVTVSLSSV